VCLNSTIYLHAVPETFTQWSSSEPCFHFCTLQGDIIHKRWRSRCVERRRARRKVRRFGNCSMIVSSDQRK
jgi:hypothetical protein